MVKSGRVKSANVRIWVFLTGGGHNPVGCKCMVKSGRVKSAKVRLWVFLAGGGYNPVGFQNTSPVGSLALRGRRILSLFNSMKTKEKRCPYKTFHLFVKCILFRKC